MVAPADLERFRQANAGLSKMVRDLLEAFFLSLNLSKPEAARDALLEYVPILVARYGDVAATLAAEWYSEQRAASGAVGRFTALTAASVAPGPVEAKVRFLAGHLWTPTPELMLGGLRTSADKYIKQPGRDTIAKNAKREGVRWARVPTGAKTCAFCLVMASRDAIYVSKQSAGDINNSGHGDGFHGDCDCQVVPIRKASDYPAGYLPDSHYQMYQAARAQAQSGNLNDIAAAFRRIHPGAVNDGVHTH